MEILLLIFIGVVGGLIAGTLGLGGGVFYILVLPYIIGWYGIPTEYISSFVVANSLLGIAFASIASLVAQFSQIKRYFSEIFLLSVPAVIISLLITKFVVHSSWFSTELFNILVVFIMIFILVQMFFKNKNIQKESVGMKNQKIRPKEGIFSGSVAGLISALSGLGGGIIIIPILNLYLNQDLYKTKTISLSVIFMSSLFISIENFFSQPNYYSDSLNTVGFIIPAISTPLVLGVIIGGPLGIKLSSMMSEKHIKLLFVFFVLLVLIDKLINLF